MVRARVRTRRVSSQQLATSLPTFTLWGQWIQQGERSIFETVISVETPNEKLLFPHDDENLDGLNFLEGQAC